MKCIGDFAELVIEIACTSHVIEQTSYLSTGTFSLKYINLFIKSSSLCSNGEIYLKKNYPLILVYRIGSLGKVQFVLAPVDSDDNTDDQHEETEEKDIEMFDT